MTTHPASFWETAWTEEPEAVVHGVAQNRTRLTPTWQQQQLTKECLASLFE